MGYQRGGLYSYDWLDRLLGFLDRPSATRILPEFQHLSVGDKIPLPRGQGYPVAVVEPGRTLVLDMRNMWGFDWVWQFGLLVVDQKRTRLVSRSTLRPLTIRTWLLGVLVIEPAAFFMTRRMLPGLKQRAESLQAKQLTQPRIAERPCPTKRLEVYHAPKGITHLRLTLLAVLRSHERLSADAVGGLQLHFSND
jgi:hypothetical protein